MDDQLATSSLYPPVSQSPSSRTIHNPFSRSPTNSTVSYIGYPQSSLRYALCDPVDEFRSRQLLDQPENNNPHSMQNVGVYEVSERPFSSGLPSVREDTHESDRELVATGSRLSPSMDNAYTAHEAADTYIHNDADNISFRNRCGPHVTEASVISSPSARRNLESTVATFESAAGYAAQDNDWVTSPSILITASRSWLPTNNLCHDIRRRPSPYALLPALQFPSEFGPPSRAPPDTNTESGSVVPIDDHEVTPHHDASEPSTENHSPTVKKKKAKMHACQVCGKNFPRPSGLKTHMNTHNNHKPFSCAYPGCERMFTVRSNAKRHLRTHGIHPEDAIAESMIPRSVAPEFEVNFNEPVVQEHDHELSSVVPPLKWMPPSLSSRTNAASLRSISEESDSDWEDGKEDPVVEQCAVSLAIPLQPIAPSEREIPSQDLYTEERDSYEEPGVYPYHASQYNRLPGPVAENPRSMDRS